MHGIDVLKKSTTSVKLSDKVNDDPLNLKVNSINILEDNLEINSESSVSERSKS